MNDVGRVVPIALDRQRLVRRVRLRRGDVVHARGEDGGGATPPGRALLRRRPRSRAAPVQGPVVRSRDREVAGREERRRPEHDRDELVRRGRGRERARGLERPGV